MNTLMPYNLVLDGSTSSKMMLNKWRKSCREVPFLIPFTMFCTTYNVHDRSPSSRIIICRLSIYIALMLLTFLNNLKLLFITLIYIYICSLGGQTLSSMLVKHDYLLMTGLKYYTTVSIPNTPGTVEILTINAIYLCIF